MIVLDRLFLIGDVGRKKYVMEYWSTGVVE